MSNSSYGAIVMGRPTGADACSSVEARTVDGVRIVLLTAVLGDLATPALESIKGAFARITRTDDAATLANSAPPPPYAAAVAVVLLAGQHAHVATSGPARCYRERGGRLEELAPGAHELEPGDAILASSHASLPVGRSFFGADVPAGTEAFHHDGLDAALETALGRGDGSFVALAAALLG